MSSPPRDEAKNYRISSQPKRDLIGKGKKTLEKTLPGEGAAREGRSPKSRF